MASNHAEFFPIPPAEWGGPANGAGAPGAQEHQHDRYTHSTIDYKQQAVAALEQFGEKSQQFSQTPISP